MQTISLFGTEELLSRFQGALSTPSPSAQVGVLVGGRALSLGPTCQGIACRV